MRTVILLLAIHCHTTESVPLGQFYSHLSLVHQTQRVIPFMICIEDQFRLYNWFYRRFCQLLLAILKNAYGRIGMFLQDIAVSCGYDT